MFKSSGILRWITFFGVLLTFGSLTVFGQVQTGTILGTVTDASGGVIPGATVTVINLGTGISRAFKTDNQGRYSVPDLPIGAYNVEAQMQGFSIQIQPDVSLSIGQQLVINLKLAVGSVTQQVTVSTQTAQVNTTTGSVSTLIAHQQMEDLPLNGRDYTELFSLVPAVTTYQPLGGGAARGLAPNFSIAGMRSSMGSILLDGFEIRSYWGNSAGLIIMGTSLGVDGIAEFQTLTNSFSAEYEGMSVINQVTRSGTNQFHGSAYGYFRNSAMDTRNFFDPATGPPPFHRYQYGGALGGPIKRNKTFFFANYEGYRAAQALLDQEELPDANAHNGYIPCVLAPNVTCITSGQYIDLANVGVSPAVAPYLALYPLPSGAQEIANTGTEQYTLPGQEPQTENYVAIKIDHQITANNSVAVRYVLDSGLAINPWPNGNNVSLPGINNIIPNFESDPEQNQYLTIQDRHIFSPNLLNLASISFVRTNQGENDNLSKAPPIMTFVPGYPMGAFTISGVATTEPSSYLPLRWLQNTFAESDEVDWVHGAHSLKFGIRAARLQCNCVQDTSPGGTYAFASNTAQGLYSGLQAFLEDKPNTFTAPAPGETNAFRYVRQFNLSGFVQDDWRVTKRVTINLGLRDDFVLDPTEATPLIYQLVNPLTDPGFTLEPHFFEKNPSTRNIDPRVGFAWDVFGDQKTSLRGGFGVFHSVLYPRDYSNGSYFSYPFGLSSQRLPNFPNAVAGGFGTASNSLPSLRAADAWNSCCTPYGLEYNLTVEQQLPARIITSEGYIGSAGVHLWLPQNYNTVTPVILPNGQQYRAAGTGPFPNPNWSYIQQYIPEGNSHYNGLVITAERNVGNLISFQSGFTWSKCQDVGSALNAAEATNDTSDVYLVPSLPKAYNYGLCAFNTTWNWTTNALVPLPFHGNQFKEGWEFGAIASLRSGAPITPVISFDQANLGPSNYTYFSQRPNLNTSFSRPQILGRRTEWFNPAGYSLQPVGYLGNAGRNSIVGPGSIGLDVSFMKDTKIKKLGEGGSIEIRADAFNSPNHANFALPNATIFTGANAVISPTAGVISTTITSSRQIQLSSTLTF